MVFIPPPPRNRHDENIRKQLLLNRGVNVMFQSIKGSEIGIISKIVRQYELSDYFLEEIIPQDKEILSIQLIPHKVIYQDVSEWMLVVIYRK